MSRLVVDTSHLYWTNRSEGTIVRADLDGTNPTVIATGQDIAAGVAVDSSHLYWTSLGAGTVVRADLDGSNPTVIAEGRNIPFGLAVGPQ